MSGKKHIRFDWAMKRLLRNKANFVILEGFLSELLKKDIIIQEILESESNQPEENTKYNRVDILVKDSKGNFMLIEVQNEKEDDYFHRMLFGQARLISERLNSGDLYGKLTRIYSINIVYFPLGVGQDYIYKSNGNFKGLHHNDTLELTDKQKRLYNVEEVSEIFTQYYILKVNAFNDIAKDTLDEWIYFLKNSEIKDNFTAKGLNEAKSALRIDDLSPSEKEEYEIYIKSARIRESEIRTAFTDGIIEAERNFKEKLSVAEQKIELERKQKEEERRQREIAENKASEAQNQIAMAVKAMFKQNTLVSEIAVIFGKSEDEIKNMLES